MTHLRDTAPGRLFGVGLGPGDPELVTLKARRVIGEADVVAYLRARRSAGVARATADSFIRHDHVEVPLTYPVTTEETEPPGGYEQALRGFYDAAAGELAAHLDAGRSVAVLCEGDPFFYGSYMYLHDRLAHRYETEVVPGVTSIAAASAASGTPLVSRDDVLTIIPGTLPPEAIAARLRGSEAAVVMKLGRTFDRVRAAAQDAEVVDRAIYVERASGAGQRVLPLRDVDGPVPYMSLVLVPSPIRPSGSRPGPRAGEVAVIGLGPAGPQWLTPEAQSALADAEELVGYATYLARVPVRAGQARHASGNMEELDRARHALQLAAGGKRVALVSSGDPGVFAMATAVLEVLEEVDGDLARVPVRIVPGLSAMQAAAARVGAPLGHDFCVVSLSDRLKPWQVIERRVEAAGAADLVLVIYNPASRTRHEQLERTRDVLLRHRRPETPTVIARDVGGPGEELTVTTLADFVAGEVDMRTLVIIGSSTTRVVRGGGPPRVYTPRSYPA